MSAQVTRKAMLKGKTIASVELERVKEDLDESRPAYVCIKRIVFTDGTCLRLVALETGYEPVVEAFLCPAEVTP